ncbi:hypothetical protein N7466_001365 [Penicillium verhagenii]|uniref:uncharacterized protein n=1 Tax=Penicillium verhagenii TaxID=1562060 RepID=UPI002545B62C|nr:uncharacterized protein N7466_001365 [Penicillium verhagenii]KAJ5948350.1 hypothetical protein N7466_001365 [Penicillium verhagenii]
MLELLRRSMLDVVPNGSGAGNEGQGSDGDRASSETKPSTYYGTETVQTDTITQTDVHSANTSPAVASTITTSKTPTSTAATTSPTATSISTSTNTAVASSHSGGESTTTKLAIALPIAIVGALAIMAAIYFFIRRRRRRQQHDAVPSSPTYHTKDGKVTSTTQILTAPVRKPVAAGLPRFPIIDVPGSRESEVSSGGLAGQMSTQQETPTGSSFGMAVSRDQRPNTTSEDLRGISRSASPVNAVESQIRLPFENREAVEDDEVSVVSNEQMVHGHDYDDMSSVSSFDGDSPRTNDARHPFR